MKKQCTKRARRSPPPPLTTGRATAKPGELPTLPLQLNKKCGDYTTTATTTTMMLPPPLLRALSLPQLCGGLLEGGGKVAHSAGALCRTTSCVSIRHKLAPCAGEGSERVGNACHFYGRSSFMSPHRTGRPALHSQPQHHLHLHCSHGWLVSSLCVSF